MGVERTLSLIKPDAVAKNVIGQIKAVELVQGTKEPGHTSWQAISENRFGPGECAPFPSPTEIKAIFDKKGFKYKGM